VPGHHPQPAALHASHDAEWTPVVQYGAARVICMNSPAVIAFPTQLTAATTTAINHESETDIIHCPCSQTTQTNT
jgi:hypothetical protein